MKSSDFGFLVSARSLRSCSTLFLSKDFPVPIDLDIAEGSIVAIVGLRGSGNAAILGAIAGRFRVSAAPWRYAAGRDLVKLRVRLACFDIVDGRAAEIGDAHHREPAGGRCHHKNG